MPNRGHRHTVFKERAKFVGISSGEHSKYGTMVCLSYASVNGEQADASVHVDRLKTMLKAI